MPVKDKIESIVRKVVSEYLKKSTRPQVEGKVLILLDHETHPNAADVWEAVRFIAKNYETIICSSDKWSTPPEDIQHLQIISLQHGLSEEIKQVMDKSDVLFLATASFKTIAKLALTIDDDLSMRIATHMQFNGKKLIVANDQCQLLGTQKITTPYSVSKRLKAYFKQLREDNVQIMALAEVANWLDTYFEGYPHHRHVVLAKHIEEAVRQGEKELVVPKHSLITPMCKDYAKELAILIRQEE